ncbi:MAG: hypothetical protein WDZ73_00040 [Candidatus Paceibacterota bacterium]
MPVVIDRGKHQHPIPKGLDKLIEGELKAARFPVDLLWKVKLGASIKGAHHISRFKVLSLDRGSASVKVETKVGNNKSARACFIRPPSDSGISLEDIHQKLGGKTIPSNGVKIIERACNQAERKKDVVDKTILDREYLIQEILESFVEDNQESFALALFEITISALVRVFKDKLDSITTTPEATVLAGIKESYEDRVGKNSLPKDKAQMILRLFITKGYVVKAIKKGRPRYRLTPAGVEIVASKLNSGQEVEPHKEEVVIEVVPQPEVRVTTMTASTPDLAPISTQIKAEISKIASLIEEEEGKRVAIEVRLTSLRQTLSKLEQALTLLEI